MNYSAFSFVKSLVSEGQVAVPAIRYDIDPLLQWWIGVDLWVSGVDGAVLPRRVHDEILQADGRVGKKAKGQNDRQKSLKAHLSI